MKHWTVTALLPVLLICGGCLTPKVWQGVDVKDVGATRIAGFIPADRLNAGRAVVIEYTTHEGLFPQRLYCTVPVDEDWRPLGGVDFDAIEDAHPIPMEKIATTQQWQQLNDIVASISASDEFKDFSQHLSVSSFKPGRMTPVAVRSDVAGRLSTQQPQVGVFYYTPFLSEKDGPNEAGERRWLAMPTYLPIPAANRAGTIMLAVAATPVTLVYDVTVVPVVTLFFVVMFSTNPM